MPPIASMRADEVDAPPPRSRWSGSRRSRSRPSGSTTSAAPVSCSRICWVRTATLMASSDGIANASSNELVCSDCVPPRTAASACIAVRAMLLSGCWAVSETPGGLAVRPHHPRARVVAAEPLAREPRPQPAAARNLAISSKKSFCTSQKNETRGASVSGSMPRVRGALEVAERPGERQRRPPARRRSRRRGGGSRSMLTGLNRGMTSAQYSIVSTTSSTDGSGGKMNSFCAVYSLRMSFCVVPVSRCAGDAALLADDPVHRDQDRGRRVDRQRRRHRLERDAVEQRVRVDDGVDGDADLADLAAVDRVVGVVAEQRRQVEVGREAGLAVGEQVLVAAVGVLGLPETRDLADRPRPAAVHARVRPAGVRELARIAEVAALVELRDVRRRVDILDLEAREGVKSVPPRRGRVQVRPEALAAPPLEAGAVGRRPCSFCGRVSPPGQSPTPLRRSRS